MMSGDGVMEFSQLAPAPSPPVPLKPIFPRLLLLSHIFSIKAEQFGSLPKSLFLPRQDCETSIELSNLTCFSDLDLISKVATLVQSTKFS